MADVRKKSEQLYFDNTKSKVEQMQAIPYFASKSMNNDDISTFIFNFDRYTSIDSDECGESSFIINITDEVVFYRAIRKKTVGVVRRMPLLYAINNKWIEPIMVFVNNRFIKWTDIYLYTDRRNTYLMIDFSSIDKEIDYDPEKIDILHLPFFVDYYEDNTVVEDKQLIFIFDKTGVFDYSGTIRIYMDKACPIDYFECTSALGEVNKYDLNYPDSEHIYPNNVITFKDGLLYREAKIDIDNYNALTIDDGVEVNTSTYTYKIFREPGTTLELKNFNEIPNHDYLKHLEYNDKMTEMFKILNTEFDYEFNPKLSYEENIKSFSKYIYRYNYRKILEEIVPEDTYIISYKKSDLMGRMKDNGYVDIPYPKKFHTSCFPIIFINGYLGNMLARKYGKNGFEFNIKALADDDIKNIEVIYFRSYWDHPLLPYSYKEAGVNTYFFNDVEKIDIMCKWHPEKCFEMDDEDRCYYTVDSSLYTYKNNALTFKDDTYVDKDLLVVPHNRVIYEQYIIKANNYRVIMSDKFDYSNREEHYMVFINGKKLNSALYRVIIPSPVRPFNNRAVYFHRMLKAGDIVEVIYSPMATIDEIYIKDLDHSSEPGTGIDELGYITGPESLHIPMSNKLQFYFINGRKVYCNDIMNISYDLVRVTKDYKSIEDLCIINFDPSVFKELADLDISKSLLDEVYGYMTKSEINIATNTYTYINNYELAEKADFDKESIMHQIIRDYYVHVNKGVPFRYTYDEDTFTEVDSAGNIILDVIDGTTKRNLKVEEVKSDGE